MLVATSNLIPRFMNCQSLLVENSVRITVVLLFILKSKFPKYFDILRTFASFFLFSTFFYYFDNVQSNPIITNTGAPKIVYCPRSFSLCIQMIVRLMTAIPNCLSLLMTHQS